MPMAVVGVAIEIAARRRWCPSTFLFNVKRRYNSAIRVNRNLAALERA
jgi:hypothetical protein